MYSNNDKEKMHAFIKRLMLNPCFITETPLAIEENIILFFLQNYRALMSTFSSPDFFPGLNGNIIQDLFFRSLMDETNIELIKLQEKIIFNQIDFNLMNKILNRQIDPVKFKTQVMTFLNTLLERFEVRRCMDPIFKTISFGVIDKYMGEVFLKKSYTAREIDRVEKLNLGSNFSTDYIKLLLIFGSLGFIRHDIDAASIQHKIAAAGEIKFANTGIQKSHYKSLVDKYSPMLSLFPKDILDKSLKMHLSFIDDQYLPATSRIAKIFYFYGKNYKPNIKIDKGAETYGKSWFHVQRRNYKFYGFDSNILDELYRIAADNYW